ncbi:MAG: DUF3341 domain-containing protein [Methylovirgula sp.]
MSTRRILALFDHFDAVSDAIREVRGANLPTLNVENITIKSPIEHPHVEELLGPRPAPVRKYTLIGALLGGSLGFLFVAAAQGNFYAQMKGGKPIIPLPPDFVLTYEMLILGGVYVTVFAFLICAGLPVRMKSSLYNVKISEDQIGVMVKAEKNCIDEIKKIFQRHHALKIEEEAVE